MRDYNSIRSSNAYGSYRFNSWRDKWIARFYRPVAEDQMRTILGTTPLPMLKEMYKQNPTAFENAVRKLGGMNVSKS